MRAIVATSLAAALLWVSAAPAPAGTSVRCHGQTATIVGTAGEDHLVGTDGADVIAGLGGADRIEGRGGDDVICGGEGADRIDGGRGEDRLFGQLAEIRYDRGGSYLVRNHLEGGPGDDLIDPGVDTRRTDQGGDVGWISYDSAGGPVRVDLTDGRQGTVTGQGSDTIRIRSAMVVEGSSHDDLLLGGPRRDFLIGGPGNDELHGGEAADTLEAEADDLVGPADDDVLYGDGGNDDIITWKGSDAVHGGAGDDNLGTFSRQPTQVSGEDGDDSILLTITSAPGYLADGGPGRDTGELITPGRGPSDPGATVTLSAGPGTVTRDGVVTGTVAGFEELTLADELRWAYYGTDAADVVTSGYSHRFVAYTYGGDDMVTGSQRDDFIDAGEGVDAVSGLEGDDTCLNAEQRDGCEATSVSP